MPAVTLSVACLLLAQTGPGLEFEPQPRAPALRGSQFEQTAPKAPPARFGEPALGKPKTPSAEPKTIIQPSTRRPPVTLERNEPESDTEFSAPPFKPRTTRPAAPAMPVEPEEEETYTPPPRGTNMANRGKSSLPSSQAEATHAALANMLLKNSLHNPQGLSLPGQSTSLLSVLDRTSDRSAQIKVVKTYWLLAAGVAEHHYARNEVEFLNSLPNPRTGHEQSVLAAAQASATAHLRQAELAATATQQDLADAAQLTGKSALPLPADVPYVGNYRTSFKELFANRTAPAALRRIDSTLPKLRELVDAQAAAVSAADKSLYALSQAYEDGEASLSAVLESYTQLRRQRREFLVAVRDYNFSIADYALSVANPGTSRNAVVSMLIETTSRTKSVLVTPSRDVLPASAEGEFGPTAEPEIRLTPDDGPGAFRAPANRDLVPVRPPTLSPSEFFPQR